MSQHASDDGGGGQPSHQHHALTKGEDDAEEEHTSSHAGNAVDKSAEKAHSDEDRSPATPAQHNVDKQSAEGEAALHAMTPHESTAGSSTSTTSTTTTAESRSAARADEDAAAVHPVRLTPARALLAPTLRVPLRLRRPRRMDLPLRIGRPGNTGANDAASANGTSSTNSTNSNNTSARESLRRMSMRATGLHHYNSSNHHHYYYYYYHNPHGPHSHRVTPRTTALTTPNGSGGQGHAALAGGALVSPREATTVLRSPESPAAATAAAATMTTSPLTQHTVPVQPAGRHSGAGTAAAMPSSEAATQPAVDATQHPSQQQQQQQERGLMPAAERYGRRPHPRPTTTGVHSHRGMPVAGLGADLGIGRNADARVYLNTNVMHVHRNARHGPRRWTTSSPAPTTTTATTHTSAAVANAGNAAARATRPSTATTLLPRQTSAAVDEAAVGRSPSQSQHRHSLIAFSAHDATSPTELNTNVAYPAQSLFSPSCVSLPGLLSSCTTPAPAPLQTSAETRSPFSETNTTATSTPAAAASRAMSAATRPANITITTTRHASTAGGSQRVASAHSASRPAAQPPPPLLTTTIASTEGSSGQLAGEAAPNVSDTTPRDMDEVEERALLLPWESCSHSTLFRSAPAPPQAAAAAVTTMSLRAAHDESARDTSVRSKASSRTGEEERAASRRSARAATHDETSDADRAQPSSPYGRTSSSAEHVAPSTNNKKREEEEEDNKAAALQEETQHEPSAVVPGTIANIVTTTTTTTSAGNASASNAGAANNNNNNNNATTTSFSVTTQKLGISGSSPLLSSQTSGLSSSLAHSVQISSIEDAISAVTRTPLTNASPPGIATHSFAPAPHTTASPQVSSAPTAPTAAAAGTALFGFFGMLERATCFQEFAVLRRLYDVELRPFLEQVTEHIFAIEGHSSVARVHNHLMQLFFTSCENEKVGEEFYSDPTNSWPLHVLYLICCFYITASRCGYGRLYAAMQRSGGLLTLGKGMFAALAVAMAPRAEDLPRTTANMYLAAFYVGALMRRQQRRLEPALEDVTQRYFALLLVNIPVFTLRQLVEQVNSGRCGSLFTTAATAAANSTGNHPNAGHETNGGNHAASGSLGRSTTSIATNTTTTMTTTSCLSTTMPHSEIEVSRIISSRSAIVCGHPLDLLRLDIVLTRYADFNGIKIHKDYLPATAPENSGYYNRSMVFDLLAYWHTKGIAFCPNQLHLRLFSPCNGEVWSAEAFSNARRGASSGNASAAATAAMMNACSNDNVGGGAARFARCVAEAATYRNQDLTYSLHHLHDRDVLLDFSMHALSVGPLIAWANKEITILSVPTNRREGSVLPPPRRSAQDSAMLGTLYKLSVINDILHQVPVRMRPCAETPIGGVELFTTFEQLGLLRVVKAATVPAEHDYQPSPNEPPATQHTRQESAKERRAAAQHVPSEAAAAAARGAGDVRSAHDDADGDAARADRVDERSGTIDLSVHTPPRHDEAVAEDTAHDKDEALHEAHEEGRGGEGEGSAEAPSALPSMYCSCSSTSSSASALRQPQRRAAAAVTTTTTMTAVTTSAVTSGEADTEEASPLSHVVPRRSHAQSAPHERYTSEAAAAAAATTATTGSNPPPSTASQTDKALTSSSSTTNASALPSSQAASSDWISLMSGPHSTSNVAAVVAAVAGAARLYAARSHNTHNASGTAPPTAFPSPPFTPSPLPLGSSAVVPATTSTTSVASADLNDAAASLLVLHGGAPLPQSALAVGHEGVATAAASSSSSSALYARGEAAAGSGRAGASEMFLCSEDYVIQRNPHFADVINVFKVSETIKYYEMQFGCVLREGALRFATLLKERTGMDFPLYMLLMCPNVFTLLEMWDGYIFIERWCSDSED